MKFYRLRTYTSIESKDADYLTEDLYYFESFRQARNFLRRVKLDAVPECKLDPIYLKGLSSYRIDRCQSAEEFNKYVYDTDGVDFVKIEQVKFESS